MTTESNNNVADLETVARTSGIVALAMGYGLGIIDLEPFEAEDLTFNVAELFNTTQDYPELYPSGDLEFPTFEGGAELLSVLPVEYLTELADEGVRPMGAHDWVGWLEDFIMIRQIG